MLILCFKIWFLITFLSVLKTVVLLHIFVETAFFQDPLNRNGFLKKRKEKLVYCDSRSQFTVYSAIKTPFSMNVGL